MCAFALGAAIGVLITFKPALSNEMARFCEYAVAQSGGLARSHVQQMNRELRRELHMSRKLPGYFVPIELVHGSSTPDTGVARRHHLRLLE